MAQSSGKSKILECACGRPGVLCSSANKTRHEVQCQSPRDYCWRGPVKSTAAMAVSEWNFVMKAVQGQLREEEAF